jgi:hypothetical protein
MGCYSHSTRPFPPCLRPRMVGAVYPCSRPVQVPGSFVVVAAVAVVLDAVADAEDGLVVVVVVEAPAVEELEW